MSGIDLFYVILAVIYASFLSYMFVYNARH